MFRLRSAIEGFNHSGESNKQAQPRMLDPSAQVTNVRIVQGTTQAQAEQEQEQDQAQHHTGGSESMQSAVHRNLSLGAQKWIRGGMRSTLDR
jgi:hypothetical protein